MTRDSFRRSGFRFASVPAELIEDDRKDAYDLAVYAAITLHCDYASGEAYPGITRIAAYAGCGRTRVKTAIAHLVDLGWLDKSPRQSEDGRQSSNLYRVRSSCDPARSQGDPTPGRVATPPRSQGDPERKPTDEIQKNETTAAAAIVGEVRQSTEAAFVALDSNEGRDWAWGREGKALKTLAERACRRPDPERWMARALQIFADRRKSGSQWYRDQPWLPSTLASSTIWARISEAADRSGDDRAEAVDAYERGQQLWR